MEKYHIYIRKVGGEWVKHSVVYSRDVAETAAELLFASTPDSEVCVDQEYAMYSRIIDLTSRDRISKKGRA